jgi:hypothetical protein
MKKFGAVQESIVKESLAGQGYGMKKERGAVEATRAVVNRSRLIPVPQWENHHIWPPIGGLRHLIFHEKKNGFSECVVRVGRRVLIDEDKFFQWAEKINGKRLQ